MKRILIVTSLLAALLSTGAATAQTAPLESRLRDQLRDTRSQLQDLQAQQAQWQAQKAALEGERDAARSEAEAAKKNLAGTKARPPSNDREIAAEREKQAVLAASVDRYRGELDASTQTAHAAEAERAKLAAELKATRENIDTCAAKNARLYTVGKDILAAYENVDMGDVIAARQPFAAKARVRLDAAAQAFGDKLYEQKFDARSAKNP
ncbi:hypothetical protein EC912_1095 [Luteibacter rhizovicinus]|uniref:DNA repair protein n=1 Tax=Luteibacter rhizovicinus TaxID=242606 RepID=A0A4R3YGQ1_9GAMM|nr:DNA repair protein [Luteibacter rhizovicinus]TCV91775.1 hypothetical protein EC912_1095 [Luteibacter rhizovicinus]